MYAECSFLWGLEVQTNQIIFCQIIFCHQKKSIITFLTCCYWKYTDSQNSVTAMFSLINHSDVLLESQFQQPRPVQGNQRNPANTSTFMQ